MSKIMNQQKLSFFEPYYNIWIDCITCIQHFCWPEFDRIYRCCKTMFECDVRVSLWISFERNKSISSARSRSSEFWINVRELHKVLFQTRKIQKLSHGKANGEAMLRWRHAKQLYTCVAVLFFFFSPIFKLRMIACRSLNCKSMHIKICLQHKR